MIFYRRLKEPSLVSLKRHLDKYSKLEIKSDAAIEDQPDGRLYGVDVSVKVYQTFKERLYRLFIRAPISLFSEFQNCSFKYPFGATVRSERNIEEIRIHYIKYFSWKNALISGFRDFSFHLKETFKKFVWIDWAFTLDGKIIEEQNRKEEEEFKLDREDHVWVHLCDIDYFTSSDQIVQYSKDWIKKVFSKEPEIIYNDGRVSVDLDIDDHILESLQRICEEEGKSLNYKVNEILSEIVNKEKEEL
jgi:hypothetical protein